jgi:TPR repeat protein
MKTRTVKTQMPSKLIELLLGVAFILVLSLITAAWHTGAQPATQTNQTSSKTVVTINDAIVSALHDNKTVDANPSTEALSQRAKNGSAEAQYTLGAIYEDGSGVRADPEQAAKWYKLAAEKGNIGAQRQLGILYYSGKLGPEESGKKAGVVWFRQAAEGGDIYSQNQLGEYYGDDDNPDRNLSQASMWRQKAAEQGDAAAQAVLGWYYEEGKGVPKDNKLASQWFQKSADQGDSDGQFSLAGCYFQGKGVDQDIPKALELFHKSAAAGNWRAQSMLKTLEPDK